MLEVKNLRFAYKKNLVLENINFQISNGEIVSILGLNGSGKTTLLKTLAKIEKPQTGIILVDNKDIHSLTGKDLAKIMGYLPQKSHGELVTVYDAILLGRKIYFGFVPQKEDHEIVERMIKHLNLEKIAKRYTSELSGGELQKVLIARALVQEPKILLLDEPINHLDIYNQIEVMDFIKKVVKKLNLIALIVLHDLNFALKYADKFILLKDKKIFASGKIEEINQELIKKVFKVEVTILKHNNKMTIIPEKCI